LLGTIPDAKVLSQMFGNPKSALVKWWGGGTRARVKSLSSPSPAMPRGDE
jgi:hypothetical protein